MPMSCQHAKKLLENTNVLLILQQRELYLIYIKEEQQKKKPTVMNSNGLQERNLCKVFSSGENHEHQDNENLKWRRLCTRCCISMPENIQKSTLSVSTEGLAMFDDGIYVTPWTLMDYFMWAKSSWRLLGCSWNLIWSCRLYQTGLVPSSGAISLAFTNKVLRRSLLIWYL